MSFKFTLLLLKKGELWQPSTQDTPVADTIPSSGTAATGSGDTTPACMASSPARAVTIAEGSSNAGEASPTSCRLTSSSPLPTFSPRIEHHLKSATESRIWRELISESANFYVCKYPELGSPGEYQMIGRKMFSAFPSIAREGDKEWSFFTKCLSQRIRHIRWAEKKKTQPPKRQSDNPRLSSAKAPRVGHVHLLQKDVSSLTADDYENHLAEVRREWSKGNTKNKNHLMLLLSETFACNQQWIKSLPDSKMEPILQKIPCYQDGSLVIHDFLKIIGESSLDSILNKMEIFLTVVESLIGTSTKEPERIIPVIRHVEKATAFDKGKGVKSKSVITIKEDISDDEVEEVLKTGDRDPPHLLVLKKGGTIAGTFVVGDTVSIMCHSTSDKSITSAMLTLIAVYYVFDLDYPKIYSQLLGTLQSHVVGGIPFDGKKSAKFRSFSNVLDKKLLITSRLKRTM
ncbi:uncharacterized protein LOC119735869 [Patiria miniata]|uniref:Uncharacterized protein n=1 Tax=Patiria miniata TaxID=46514 RepID=A0A914ANY5_PATMI|nr:uncharacterized protein LOC119735869 [Patiria miniata]